MLARLRATFSKLCWLPVVIVMSFAPAAGWAREVKAIGVLVGDLGNPFFYQIGKGVEIAASRLGDGHVRVSVVTSGYDFERQVQQIDDFVAAKYDMLVLNAVDTHKIVESVERARRAGMVVIAVDVNADGADATVTSDNYQAGELACEHLAERVNGRGDVVILNGPPVSAITDRVKGCEDTLARYPGIAILSDDQNAGASLAGGLAAMSTLLTSNPHIDAVFAINDPSAIGADLAASQANRKDFFIVSVDASPNALRVLQERHTRLVATVAQDPRIMAERAVTLGYDVLQGRGAPARPVLIPVKLITRDNLSSFDGWTQ
jgi:ribose transport system substrate-binding protein